MKNAVLLLLVLVTSSIVFGGNTNAAESQEDVAQLLRSMRGPTGPAVQSARGESARVSLEDGYLRILGAPANHNFPVSKAAAGNSTVTAKNFITEHKAAFGVKSKAVDFAPKKSNKRNGRSYERFQQTYSHIPVFGAEMVIQLNVSGGVEYAVSDIMRETSALDNGKVSTVPTISAADAEFLAIELMAEKHKGLQLDSSDAQLMIYQPAVVGNSGPTRLVWQTVVVSVSVPTVNEFILIDAHTGEVAMHYTQIMDALNRQIYDSANTAADPGTLRRSEGGSVTGIADVDNCYDYFGDIYNFYFNEHGRNSIDNAGMILSATVRICPSGYTCPYQNAFWNGARMYFGQGFVVDDVTGHELTHGVTQYESDLIYQNESGAINESFSDMWGEWIDLTNGDGNDVPSVRWLMGEDIPGIGAIRNMANPPSFGDPDRKGSPLWYTGSGDNGGVHTNSGVGNKLCYLLTDGAAFNGKTVMGMGISTVADLFYEAQTNLLTSGSDYADLHDSLTQAAINLGWSVANRDNLENACLATELSYSPPTPANDECVNAVCVEDGVAVNGTTVNATGADITSCTMSDAADVWYSYTPSVSGSVTVSLCGSSYDTSLAVFSACGGTELVCNDDYSSCGLSSQITINLTSGTIYRIRVSGYGGQSGSFVITVTGGQGTCGPIAPMPPAAQTGSADTQVDTPVTITLAATDDGLPNPPGAMTYIITSLPSNGTLSDPGNGIISSVPYSLVGFGNHVIYTPAVSFTGSDGFQFKANDGGAPPEGGDSNIAAVSITVNECTPAPVNPEPTDGAANVPIDAILQWNGSSDGFVLDNFNRLNSTDMGANWSEQAGDFSIFNNIATSTNGSLMTWQGAYPGQRLSVDVLQDGLLSVQYVAIVSGYANIDNCVFIKVQKQGTTQFTYIGFYFGNSGNNNAAWPNSGFTTLTTPFTTARMTTLLEGDTVTLLLDTNFDGVAEQTYTRNGLPTQLLGTGVGLGGYGSPLMDNFAVPPPDYGMSLGLGKTPAKSEQPSADPTLDGGGSSQLQNGRFETGDFTGWTYQKMKEKAIASKTEAGVNSDTPVNASQDTLLSYEATNAIANVAIFQDVNPWGFTRNQQVLTENGVSYTIYSSLQMGAVNLLPYDKLIISSVQTASFYNALQANRTWFENYVAAGGILDIHAATFSDQPFQPILPGGFQMIWSASDAVTIVDADHPIVTTPNIITDAELDGWNSSVHGYISVAPAGAQEIIKVTSSGLPCAMELNFGLGSIFVTTQTVEWIDASYNYLENTILYGTGVGVTYDVYFDTVNPPATLIHSGLTSPSCEPVPYPLACGTTYYWQVIATKSGGCQNAGPVWSFTAATFTGDLDHDCKVDLWDFAQFSLQWLNACSQPSYCNGADLTQDGAVDMLDLGMFAANWLEGI